MSTTEQQYPLYPTLAEPGAKEATDLIEKFKGLMLEACKTVLSDFYCDIVPYIETDAWTNFRNQILDGFRDYSNRKIQSEYDFAEIRKEIFKQFHDDIIPELNQDIVKENENLKKDVERLRGERGESWR